MCRRATSGSAATGVRKSASARPQFTAFDEDAYPSIHLKAAALLHSVALAGVECRPSGVQPGALALKYWRGAGCVMGHLGVIRRPNDNVAAS